MLLELIVLGVVAYLVDTYVPMQGAFKTVFRIACVAIAIYLLLGLFGIAIPNTLR